ncbi:hypothetical protein GQ54DRAFT_191495 [Martensiomyces pterosporus]|nr:hypothetical protein GQ54DRAFT_191495 [Martensiomyces pterosporus]
MLGLPWQICQPGSMVLAADTRPAEAGVLLCRGARFPMLQAETHRATRVLGRPQRSAPAPGPLAALHSPGHPHASAPSPLQAAQSRCVHGRWCSLPPAFLAPSPARQAQQISPARLPQKNNKGAERQSGWGRAQPITGERMKKFVYIFEYFSILRLSTWQR